MYGYGYRYNSGLVVGAGGGAPFLNTYSTLFDGIDDYVDCGNGASLNITGSITISCWMKTTNTGPRKLIMKDDGTNRSYQIQTNRLSSGAITYFWLGGGIIKTVSSGTPDHIVDGNWHHVVSVFKSGQYIRMYVDGIQGGNTNVTETTLDSANTPFTIASNFPGTLPIDGNVDEVSVFDRALEAVEIANLYNSGTPTDLSLLPTPPVAWYRNGDNGAYKSPQWLIPSNENKDKLSNYSFELDGIDDYIDCGDSNDFSFGDGSTDSAFSVSAWIKIKSFGTNNVVFSKDSGLPNREYAIGFFQGFKNLRFYIKDNGGNNQQSIDSTTLFALDTWYNITCTYDGSGGSNAADGMNIYVNSVLETPTNVIKGTYTAMSNTTAPVNIGRYGAAASPLNAKVDQLSLYASELSQSDVTDIYNGGEPTTISGAVAHYKMGEEATFSTNWTVPDAVGSNDGTSNAMNIFDRVGEAPSSENNALSYNMDLVDRVTDVP